MSHVVIVTNIKLTNGTCTYDKIITTTMHYALLVSTKVAAIQRFSFFEQHVPAKQTYCLPTSTTIS